MSLTTLNSYLDNLTNDVFSLDDANSVIIGCQNREPETVVGILQSPLNLKATAKFESYGEQPNLKPILNVLNGGASLISGTSLKQPWFGRKYWVSTTPLTFTVKVAFIAQTNAKAEVFDPVEALIGYLYPRKLTEGTGNGLHLYVPPGPNLFTYTQKDEHGNVSIKNGNIANVLNSVNLGTEGITGALKSAINKAQNVVAKLNLDRGGPDAHSIKVGSMIELKVCYLEEVDVTFSSALDSAGYPHYAIASVRISAFDSSYANPVQSLNGERGVFHLSQATALDCNLSGIIDGAKATLGL